MARRSGILRDSGIVAIGLTVAGLGTLVMLVVIARVYDSRDYALFATWWVTATLLGMLFGMFEVYLARTILAARAMARSASQVASFLIAVALALVGLIWLVLAAMFNWLTVTLFEGSGIASLLLGLLVLLMALQSLFRGVATARGAFGAIGVQIAGEGILRVLFVFGATVVSASSIEVAMGATCLAAALSLVLGQVMCRGWLVMPSFRNPDVPLKPLAFLLVSTGGALMINNGSVPWLSAQKGVSPVVVGAFVSALTLSRLPTQFLSAAFGPLMTKLAGHVEKDELLEYAATRRRARWTAAAAVGVFVIAFTMIGPLALTFLFGSQYSLPHWVLACLATASSLIFLSIVEQAGLAAESRWGAIARSWAFGSLAYVGVLALPLDLVLRAAVAPVVAMLVTVVAMIVPRPRRTSSIGPGQSDN